MKIEKMALLCRCEFCVGFSCRLYIRFRPPLAEGHQSFARLLVSA